jgi:hypothetical protein
LEKKERLSYPTERHASDKAPGFWDKYGGLVVFPIIVIMIAVAWDALGIRYCGRFCI